MELLSSLYVDDGRSYHKKLRHGERFCKILNKFTFDADTERKDMEAAVDRNELTRTEVTRAMNSVNSDLEFTMELCTDFEGGKLPTLSFSLYMSNGGIEHTYFEKSMKNQTLVMERSALGRNQKMNIMTNELRRRMEVVGNISQIDKNKIIDKYTLSIQDTIGNSPMIL